MKISKNLDVDIDLTSTSETHCLITSFMLNFASRTRLQFLYVLEPVNLAVHSFLASSSVFPVGVGHLGSTGTKFSGSFGKPSLGSFLSSGSSSASGSSSSSRSLLHFVCPNWRWECHQAIKNGFHVRPSKLSKRILVETNQPHSDDWIFRVVNWGELHFACPNLWWRIIRLECHQAIKTGSHVRPGKLCKRILVEANQPHSDIVMIIII